MRIISDLRLKVKALLNKAKRLDPRKGKCVQLYPRPLWGKGGFMVRSPPNSDTFVQTMTL